MNKDNFLASLYSISGLDTEYCFDREDLLKTLDIDEKTLNRLSNYWVNKGYLHGPSPTTDGSHMCLFFESDGLDHAESLIERTHNHQVDGVDKKMKIFISHSSEDIDLATSLVKLLHSSLDISKQDIRCTSVSGYKLDPGADSNEAIKNEVRNSEILIGLLTPISLNSSFVLFELGARWILDGYLIPLLASGSDYSDLPKPINNKNAIKLENSSDISDFIESVSEMLNVKKERASSYQDELDSVIEAALKKKIRVEPSASENGKFAQNDIKKIVEADVNQITLKQERENLLRSTKGVELANKSGNNFFENLKKICEENTHKSARVIFTLNKKRETIYEWEAQMITRNAYAFLKFEIPFQNSNIGFNNRISTHIRIYVANYNIFDGYSRTNKKTDTKYENYYYFNINNEIEPVWSEKELDTNFISSQELASTIFLDFYNFSKRQKN